MDGMDLDQVTEKGKTLGFLGKQIYNFVKRERNRVPLHGSEKRNQEKRKIEY